MLTIINGKTSDYTLTAGDFVDGHIYETSYGVYFIANAHDDVAAYALNGYGVVKFDSPVKFREVQAELRIL